MKKDSLKYIFLQALTLASAMALSLVCRGQHTDTLVITGDEIRQQIFPVTPLAPDYNFDFSYPFSEITIHTPDSIDLNGLLFPASSKPKGVILYLHGSNGAADVWGKIAPIYTDLGYDFFLLDYRGYGKSEGHVESEEELCRDVQLAYDTLKARYGEERLAVIGQSIGTGAAAFLGAHNHPKMMVLQAPYYAIEDWIHHMVPSLRLVDNLFKFETYRRLQQTTSPIVLIHGNADDAVYYGSSERLSKFLKPEDKFITLTGEGHNDFTKNKQYLKLLAKLLE